MDKDSIEYFRLRERMERAAAKSATCPEARRAHEELALGYAALVKSADPQGGMPPLQERPAIRDHPAEDSPLP